MIKDQDVEASDHPEVPEDLDEYANSLPKVSQDHEVPVSGARYEEYI